MTQRRATATNRHRWFLRACVALGLVLLVADIARADDRMNEALPSAPIGAMIAVTIAWVFAVGACVGSFLNVVVYRLPLGMKLSSPGSRCPVCETPIERRDNVPVLGWLWLRGRCRACRAPISVRYPLVEGATAAIIVALLMAELSSGGANLPVREPNSMQGLVWTLWGLEWELIGLFAYHAALVFLLVAAWLIAFDGQPTSRLLATGLLLGVLPPIVWPDLHPVPFVSPPPEWATQAWIGTYWNDGWLGRGEHQFGLSLVGAIDGLLGVVSGFLLGALLSRGTESNLERTNLVVIAAVIGGFLGWQTVWSVGWLASLAWITALVAARGRAIRVSPSVLLSSAAVVQLFAWRLLFAVDWWPSHRGIPILGSVGWLLVPALPAAAVLLARFTDGDRRSVASDEAMSDPKTSESTDASTADSSA